jgi:PAS domain S-box-containing protein
MSSQANEDQLLDKLTYLYAFISKVNKDIVRVEDESTLFRNACAIATEPGQFKMAWIGVFDTTCQFINLEAQSGLPDGDKQLFHKAPVDQYGPVAEVLQTGKYYICDDIRHDLSFDQWIPFIEKHGIHSCLILPIKKSGAVVGIFNLYTTDDGFHDDREIALLVELSDDISFALERFERSRKHTKTEELVINNEKKFRNTLDHMLEGVQMHDFDMRYIYVNDALVKYSPYRREEMIGYTLMDKYPGIEQTDLFKTMHRCLHKRVSEHLESEFVFPDGTIAYFELIINPIPEGISILSIDRTEQRAAKEAQKESKQLIETIYQASPDAVIIIDTSGVITKWDEKSELLFGWKEQDVVNKHLSEIIIPDRYRARHREGMKHYLKTGEATILGRSIDISALKKSGIEFDVSLSISPTQIGGQLQFVGFIRDISDKKAAEKQKEFEQQNLTALIDNTKDLLWSIDREFKLITSNQPFTDIIHFMSGKTIARASDIFSIGFPAEQMQRYKQYYERAFAGETFTVTEFTSVPVDFWSEISFHPIFKGANVIGTACHSRDITERMLAEKEKEKMTESLEKARQQEQLAVTDAVISGEEKARQEMGFELHDNINQILATAQLYMGMFLKKDPHPDNLIQRSEQMVVSAIKEIRDLAHATISPFIEDDSLPEALETLAAITERAGALKITRKFTNLEEIPTPQKLKLAIYRIVQEQFQNILKYAKASNVYLEMHCEQCVLTLLIRDDGIGFDVTRKANGIGMKNIKTRISLYQGEMAILSSPGNGCSLEVTCHYPCI